MTVSVLLRRPFLAVLLALLLAVPLALALATPASASRADPVSRFSREVVRPGGVDADLYHIEHVYEVQRRLERLGLFDVTPNGTFGPVTKAGVKSFQRSNDLSVTSVVNHRTWRPLIKQTVLDKRAVPKACKRGAGGTRATTACTTR